MPQMPFGAEDFFAVFASYNEAVWPMQFVLNAAAAGLVALALRPRPWSGRTILALLGALWVWTGVAYHLLHFTTINPAARVFGGVFLLQGVLFWWEARRPADFRLRGDARGWLGAAIMVYALVAYPLAGLAFGHAYPDMPTFGAPCPLVLFTFGLLLWSERAMRVRLLAIPLLWSAIATTAAFAFGVWQDLALPLVAVVATTLLVVERRARRPAFAGARPGD